MTRAENGVPHAIGAIDRAPSERCRRPEFGSLDLRELLRRSLFSQVALMFGCSTGLIVEIRERESS